MAADLADLFPGFDSKWLDTTIGRMFVRVGGSGPSLLLLHGYPQTCVMWHRVAPLLAPHYTLVIPDLPGYGWSVAARAQVNHAPYDKRSMALIMIEIMEQLGFARFRLAGHDRGGRVAYRLALDHPGRLDHLAVLDIVPTYTMWHAMDQVLAMRVWHWTFLAQPNPVPESLIGRAPIAYLEGGLANSSRSKDLSAFDPQALAHYRAFFQDPARIHATCEDYRAGQSVDLEADEADHAAGKKITCPVLALWGTAGIPSQISAPLNAWREWADDVAGKPIDSGHFVAEENPQATAAALMAFFGES